MRTTIDLDEDLLQTAKALAAVQRKSLSSVISELAWKGLAPPETPFDKKNGFPVLNRRPGAQPVTGAHVTELLELADAEDIR